MCTTIVTSGGATGPRRALVGVVVGLMLAFVPATGASADIEPANDTLVGAEGPIGLGVDYAGNMGNHQDDDDWYFFVAQPQVELTITPTLTDCDSHNFTLELHGRDGRNGEGDDGLVAGNWEGDGVTYTTPPGPARIYYVRLSCHPGWKSVSSAYTFRISANRQDGLVPGTNPWGPPVDVSEPNESRVQAIGPLVGGVDYRGVTATSNDEDWFYFNARPQQEIEVSATSADEGCWDDGLLSLHDEDERGVGQINPAVNRVERIRHTTGTELRRYYISVGCASSTYRFTVEPAAALVSNGCVDAERARSGLASRVAGAKYRKQATKRVLRRRIARLKRRARSVRLPARKRRAARRAASRVKAKRRSRMVRLNRRIQAAERGLAANEQTIAAECGQG